MNKLAISVLLVSSCVYHSQRVIDHRHVENLAIDFMKTNVIPTMKDPKPYLVEGAEMVVKTLANKIDDYRFSYQHLSFNKEDSVVNKHLLDSVIASSANLEAVVSVTVNVAYKTKFPSGKIVTDSIKLGYNSEKDIVRLWPF